MRQLKLMIIVCAVALFAGSIEAAAQKKKTGLIGTFVKDTPKTKTNQTNNTYVQPSATNTQQNVPQGYYIPEGGTEPVPIGYKPTMVGAPVNNGMSIENTSVGGVPATSMSGSSSSTSSSTSSSGSTHVSTQQIQKTIDRTNKAQVRAQSGNSAARANYEASKKLLKAQQEK